MNRNMSMKMMNLLANCKTRIIDNPQVLGYKSIDIQMKFELKVIGENLGMMGIVHIQGTMVIMKDIADMRGMDYIQEIVEGKASLKGIHEVMKVKEQAYAQGLVLVLESVCILEQAKVLVKE